MNDSAVSGAIQSVEETIVTILLSLPMSAGCDKTVGPSSGVTLQEENSRSYAPLRCKARAISRCKKQMAIAHANCR